MKDILSINLETSTAPVIQEVKGREYIEYGTDDWKNLYPQFLIDLYYNSSTHAAIINQTAEMIAGEDLICSDEDINLDAYVRLKKFLRHANSKESLHQVIKKVAFDFKLQGAYAINIIWNRERTEIAEIYHVPVERVRAGRPNEIGKVDTYYVSADWSNVRGNKPMPIPAFNVNDRTSPSQLLYTGAYSPNMDVYHTPDYLAACNWALVDQRVAEFHLNNINNSFSGSYMIAFNNGVPTQEERFQIEQSLTDKFTSASNAGKFVLTFSDDRTRSPEVTPLNTADLDKQYLALQELLTQNILTGHRVTSPMLMGIKNETGLGSNVDELNAASNFYLNTVVKSFQLHILDTLQTIFSVNEMDLEVKFVQLKPITLEFTSEDLKAIMTQDELREEMGLAPLEENIEIREDLTKMSEKINLTSWIEKFGEEMPEEWELVEEEVVDGEHVEFDFEGELNKEVGKKIEFAEVIEGNPNIIARDPKEKDEAAEEGGTENTYIDQDGVNRSYSDFYKVRYVYATDNFLENKSGTSREFCELMVAANKVYRKRDILDANSLEVNEGFGHYGTERYNLFLFKGGPQCRHFWLRRIYKSSLRNAKKPIKDDQIIDHVKAVSEGFTVKKNDKLVAIPPQRMDNHGYYN